MIPQAVLTAFHDRRLKRRDLFVYGVALEALSFYEPRTFKVRSAALAAHMPFPAASIAIRRLTEFGYLESGPDDGPRNTYLLRAIRTIVLP